jgi:hypothetical protein
MEFMVSFLDGCNSKPASDFEVKDPITKLEKLHRVTVGLSSLGKKKAK